MQEFVDRSEKVGKAFAFIPAERSLGFVSHFSSLLCIHSTHPSRPSAWWPSIEITPTTPMSFSQLSTRQSLLLTALATAITTTSLILSFQSLRREHRTERLKREVGEDVEEWEKSRAGSGVESPEEVAERHAEGVRTPGGGRKVREWKRGEYDEGLIREQVGLVHATLERMREWG